MPLLVVVLILVAVGALGAWRGADTRVLDPRDNAQEWPFAPYGS